MHRQLASAKGAELLSGLGAIVLGAGLALVVPDWLRRYAIPLLMTGVVVHGVGMTLKYRLDAQQARLVWWERALLWLCWACLAAIVFWIAAAAITG